MAELAVNMVLLAPFPITLIGLDISTAEDHVQLPAGTFIVSPLLAELTAACTSDREHEVAFMAAFAWEAKTKLNKVMESSSKGRTFMFIVFFNVNKSLC
jgi:hypothetical protein